jgi:hypothetical protein
VAKPIRVFLSYAHHDEVHRDQVRQLCALLRSLGIDARMDVTAARQGEFWPAWVAEQVREAQYVLVMASPSYQERTEGLGDREVGKGVRWEASLLMDRLYANHKTVVQWILPVVLPGRSNTELPNWLLPTVGTYFQINEITPTGIEKLVQVLTGKQGG